MVYSLTWLPSVLKAVGLQVAEQPGWRTRGHGDVGKTLGVLCHHTAGGLRGNAPSLAIVTDGRPGLKGPLAQLVLGRDGTFFVVAAGLAYHAGAGKWEGVSSGNAHFIGIEAENTGLPNDSPWPAVQMDAYARGVAAILKHIGAKAIMCAGHKEYALPKGRKPDPSFDMAKFRGTVAAMMVGIPVAKPVPLPDVPAPPGRPAPVDAPIPPPPTPKPLGPALTPAQATAGVAAVVGTIAASAVGVPWGWIVVVVPIVVTIVVTIGVLLWRARAQDARLRKEADESDIPNPH